VNSCAVGSRLHPYQPRYRSQDDKPDTDCSGTALQNQERHAAMFATQAKISPRQEFAVSKGAPPRL